MANRFLLPPLPHATTPDTHRRGLTLTEVVVILVIALILIGIFTIMLPQMIHRPRFGQFFRIPRKFTVQTSSPHLISNLESQI